MYLYKYFLILRFFIQFKVVLSDEQINVGTVLFTKKDLDKTCWNEEQLALLRARLIYQDILPKTTLIDLKNDEFLTALINYFHIAISKVKRITCGQTQVINLMAMCDVLGGYLRSVLIPLTKRAFYTGTINYETTENVLKFYDNLKVFLRTDGKNWAPPSDSIADRFVRECGPQSQKTNDTEDSCEKINFSNNKGCILIPIPYFDSKKSPCSIVTPFKQNPLRNMQHKSAVNCLANFYSTAKKCLMDKKATAENINKFNRDFEKFLDNEVFPRLTDENIYPAFGGVYHIKNEINRKNVEKRKNIDDYETNFTKTVRRVKNNDKEGAVELQDDDDKAPIIVLVCLCAVAALWLSITLYYCMKNRKTQIPRASITNDDGQFSNKPSSFLIKISGDEKRSSVANIEQAPPESVDKPEARKISFSDDKQRKSTRCVVCAQNSQKFSPTVCPNCKKRYCRCFKNIWNTLSNYNITYPRIFPKKKTATSGLLQKYIDVAGNQTAVSLCPECKTPKCKHLNLFSNNSEHNPQPQSHFLVQMASVIPKSPARYIKSAPVTPGNNIWQSGNNSRTVTKSESCKTDEKLFVFGYDFETSSSDDSSFTDESSDLI